MGFASIRLYVITSPYLVSWLAWGAPTPLALLVHPADDRSMLLGQFPLTE
jgi:hypothetical protein